MKKYIHQLKDWPHFIWDAGVLAAPLANAHQSIGRLLGNMEALGLSLQNEAILNTLTLDVVKNSEIENEFLDANQVRSSIARRLGIEVAGLIPSDRYIDGVVDIMLDATQHFEQPLTESRLMGWHAALFPTGRSGMNKISVGHWRDDKQGPMQVVSGPIGRERVHFEAPRANIINKEMNAFINWFNKQQANDLIVKAAIAHLWFVTIHPFDDGNGRIARTITDLQLARADGSKQRFYSMSAEIKRQQNTYYDVLEKTQQGTLDVTEWVHWFVLCVCSALVSTEITLADTMQKSRFWESSKTKGLNERQHYMINKLFEGFVGKLNTSKWAKMTKCSQDTALRDIQDLIYRGILKKDDGGGRSTSYVLIRDIVS